MKKVLIAFLILWIHTLNGYGQRFNVDLNGKNLEIDSIVIFDNLGNRIDDYYKISKTNLLQSKQITVLYLDKKKICIPIDYSTIYCDTIMIQLNKFSNCDSLGKSIGRYQTCQNSSHTISFYSNEYPCCKKVSTQLPRAKKGSKK